MTTAQSLADFTRTRSAQAFAALVQAHIDLVYSTARRVSGDAHLAEDATQAVFIVLARRANSIDPKYLAGWLVNASRLAAREMLRSRHRQRRLETEAAKMRSESTSAQEPTIEQITPLLDDALAQLNESDRLAVVMRFFQGESFVRVGQALQISDEAARKRVERAIEKLRVILCRRGITPTVGALAVVLAAHQATAAPAALAGQTEAVLTSHSTAASIAARKILWSMSIAKPLAVAAAILAALIIGGGAFTAVSIGRHPVAASQPATLPSSQPATVADDKIQPNDRLRIEITDLVGPGVLSTYRPRVDALGRISLPLIGQIQVGGKTRAEAEAEIGKGYRDSQLIQNAQVSVNFDEKGPQSSMQSAPFQIGDHLLLHIWDLEGPAVETTKLYVLDANGAVSLPIVGSLKVQGLTEFEAEKAVADEYHSAQIIQNAQVSIERISAAEANQK